MKADTNSVMPGVTEDTVPNPRTIYHRTKLEAEGIVAAAASPDLSVRIIRLSRCFPEPAPLMALYRLHRGVDYRDVAAAHLLASDWRGSACETFVISGYTPFLPSDCADLKRDAAAVIRSRAPNVAEAFDARGWPLPKSIDRVYDGSKAEQMLG